MKKLLTIALLLVGMTASAQKWMTTEFKGDELTGDGQPYTAHAYVFPDESEFVVWEWDKTDFRLVNGKGMFREMAYNTGFGPFRAVKVRVGIYQIGGQLQEKYDLYMNVEDNTMNKRIYIGSNSLKRDRKIAKKIIQTLQTQGMYVRFVCQQIGKPDFDISVPYYQP